VVEGPKSGDSDSSIDLAVSNSDSLDVRYRPKYFLRKIGENARYRKTIGNTISFLNDNAHEMLVSRTYQTLITNFDNDPREAVRQPPTFYYARRIDDIDGGRPAAAHDSSSCFERMPFVGKWIWKL
jgi:hypothetical protein